MNPAGSYKQRPVYYGVSETLRVCACGASLAKRERACAPCRFWAKVLKGPDCWLWTGGLHVSKRNREPYGEFYYMGRPRRAHIVAWALTYGELPDVSIGGNGILHSCDVTLCVRPTHLFFGTQAENMRDAAQKGRLHIARPGGQKVSPADIEVIRARVAAGELQKAVAADFGIARNTVSGIVNGVGRQYDAPLRPPLHAIG